MSPDAAMMQPIERLVRFMAGGEDDRLDEVFVHAGAVIVENFPPFLFEGAGAVRRWRSGFLEHARLSGLAELKAGFGPAQDVRRAGDRVFFTLPTDWSGLGHGEPFSESGGWAFVLELQAGDWRIRSYAWAVVAKR